MAFQVSDDLLDVEGDARRTGKPVGIDLRDGNPSLPIVLALPRSPRLQAIWKSPSPSAAEVDAGLAEIRNAGVIEQVRAEVSRWVAEATEALVILPPSPYREHLDALIQELCDRGS
jgi:geranylgeranyl pyrophosphate synthase